MVSIVDIVPQRRIVTTSAGDELEFRGLGLRQIAELLLRYPVLRNLLVEDAPAIDLETLILTWPEAMCAIIAEAKGEPEALETLCNGALPFDDMARCLMAINELTMGQDPRPFVMLLRQLLNAGGGDDGKEADSSGPPGLNSSSPPDTHPEP